MIRRFLKLKVGGRLKRYSEEEFAELLAAVIVGIELVDEISKLNEKE